MLEQDTFVTNESEDYGPALLPPHPWREPEEEGSGGSHGLTTSGCSDFDDVIQAMEAMFND